jgi:hypothetical protein
METRPVKHTNHQVQEFCCNSLLGFGLHIDDVLLQLATTLKYLQQELLPTVKAVKPQA